MTDSRRIAVVFPGQGAQAVGMGQSLAEASSAAHGVFDAFAAATPQYSPSLQAVCFSGPEDTLKDTRYTQPGILATSLAAWISLKASLQATCPTLVPTVTAGHSLGEYGALVAAGVLTVSQAAMLIVERARLMAQAPEGAMAALLGFSPETVEQVLSQINASGQGPITVANYNSAEQWVISGTASAVAQAAEQLKAAGTKRVIPLAVSGAFHSPLMQPAAQAFATFVAPVDFAAPTCPVVPNVTADATTEATTLKTLLAQQIDHSVRWQQTMAAMVNDHHITTVIECGPGTVLTGLFKKAHPGLELLNIATADDVARVAEQLSQPLPTLAAV